MVQNKAMRGYSQPQRAPAGGHALTTNYLEADMDEGEFEEDGEDGFDADARGSLSRGRYDDQVEVCPSSLLSGLMLAYG